MAILSISIISLVVFSALSIVTFTIINGISPVPSSRLVQKEILTFLENEEINCEKAVELGAGWGSLLFKSAEALHECSFTGYENSPVPYLFLRFRNKFTGSPNIEIRCGDFYKASFNGVDLVLCYLFPGAMEKLGPLLEKELSPGAIVISNTFAIKGWTPFRVTRLNDIYKTPVYFYRFTGVE